MVKTGIHTALLKGKRSLSNIFWRPVIRLSGRTPVPPRRLLVHVLAQNNVKLFLKSGESICRQMNQALDRFLGTSFDDYRDILDFGVGCGRIERWLDPAVQERVNGVDVSEPLIEFCRRNLRGAYSVITPEPALPFDDGRFDLVISFSVFSHMDRGEALAWIDELHRITRPGAVLLITTHMEWCAQNLLSDQDLSRYRETGMCVVEYGAEGDHHEKYVSVFYTEETWRGLWDDRFELTGLGYGKEGGEFLSEESSNAGRDLLPMGQALSVLRRR